MVRVTVTTLVVCQILASGIMAMIMFLISLGVNRMIVGLPSMGMSVGMAMAMAMMSMAKGQHAN